MQIATSPENVWINGEERDAVSVLDRGLAYGDGVFETMRYHANGIPLIEWHMRRLVDSCARLRIALDAARMRDEIGCFRQVAVTNLTAGVIKLIVTRGVSMRGYRVDPAAEPTRILLHFPLPAHDPSWSRDGVAIRYCDTRLGNNAALAGIKHLNRLEQVMARMEWDDPAMAEGLMADARGRIVEGIGTNLFLVSGGRMITPVLDTCGVAGVMRQYILDEISRQLAIHVTEATCERAMLAGAQELFLCNAVAGVWPVRQLAGKAFAAGPVTRRVQEHVAALFAA